MVILHSTPLHLVTGKTSSGNQINNCQLYNIFDQDFRGSSINLEKRWNGQHRILNNMRVKMKKLQAEISGL